MAKIFVLDAHPQKGSFGSAMAETYVQGARQQGHDVQFTQLRDLNFDPNLRGGYQNPSELEVDLKEEQGRLLWCEHFVLLTPLWWMGLPALLKGYIDRVFLPGFAFKYHDSDPFWDRLLKGRSARVIYTQDAPQLFARWARRDCFWQMINGGVLGFCGFKPVKRTVFSELRSATPQKRQAWLERMHKLGQRGA